MKYVALLRGINVGGKKKVEMKWLKKAFEELGFGQVVTYINSGNVIFESRKTKAEIKNLVEKKLKDELGEEHVVLVKTEKEMREIAIKIPKEWQNNSEEKTDVAYLFDEVDNEDILEKLPVRKEYVKMVYAKGAVIWHVKRENYNKSQLNKMVGGKIYQLMTVRNVNTARRLAEMTK